MSDHATAHPNVIMQSYRGISPDVHDSAFVAPGVALAGDVTIGEDSNIWYGCVLRGDVNRVVVGKRTNIQDGSVVHVSRPFAAIIGDDVTIGHMALIHACELQDGCFIGMHATVMDGAVVERGAMLAAGAVLTPNKRIPSGEVWSGTPARFFRNINDSDKEMMAYTVPHYVEMAKTYKAEMENPAP